MTEVLRTAKRLLSPSGKLVFTVPHPCLAFMRANEPPFYFDATGTDYFAAVDHTLEGRIWRRDGSDVPVRSVHKTWQDYFSALHSAGFRSLPAVTELSVTQAHVELDPSFFGPLQGYPLHVMFVLQGSNGEPTP
jgi:hypothetical protein